MPEVAKGFELRQRADDKLPFDPKTRRNGETELPSSELKQVPELVSQYQPEKLRGPDVQGDVQAEVQQPQNLILRG